MDHAYVSVKDIVSHFSKYRCMMTSDTEERLNSHVHHISESDAVREVLGRAAIACGGNDIVVLFCMEWSDDFDPATSSKQNRRSCWIKTKQCYLLTVPTRRLGNHLHFILPLVKRTQTISV